MVGRRARGLGAGILHYRKRRHLQLCEGRLQGADCGQICLPDAKGRKGPVRSCAGLPRRCGLSRARPCRDQRAASKGRGAARLTAARKSAVRQTSGLARFQLCQAAMSDYGPFGGRALISDAAIATGSSSAPVKNSTALSTGSWRRSLISAISDIRTARPSRFAAH